MEAQPDKSVRVILVDDHDFFRAGLRRFLTQEPAIEVVGEAPDGESSIDLYQRRLPDVVVMDLKMPGISGTAATERLVSRWPDARILVLTVSVDDTAVIDAVRAGASGYLVKDAPIEEIVQGILAAAAGQLVTSPRVARTMVGAAELAGDRADKARRVSVSLSDRQLDVLHLMVAGKGNAEIAAELYLSASTVKSHVAEILDKFEVENRVEAAVYAVRSGLA